MTMEEEIVQYSEEVVFSEDKSESLVETNEVEESAQQKSTRLTQLPLNKIKSIIKMDPEVSLVSNEAVFAITKATELFIECITKEAYSYTAKSKRKTLMQKDFDNVIDSLDCLFFLEGAMNF